jgi:type II secretory pathway pseudopilin PulG
MMMALLIVGLLASAAVLSFAGPLRAARSRDAIDQLRNADDLARRAATRQGRGAKLEFDLTSGTIARFEANHRQTPDYQISLPQGFRIEEIRLGNESVYADRATVSFSAAGWSNSYALHLIGPKFQKWLVFAGLSGQMTQFDDASEFDAMLAK